MATDIMGLFADLDPAARMMQQQQRFQQQLSQAVTPQQFIATVGTNLGSQLGQAAQQSGLFGQQQNPQEQRAAKRLEALQAAAASGVDQTDGVAFVREVQKQLRMRGLDAEALALESQAQDYIKTQAYVRQTETGKKEKYGTEKLLTTDHPNYKELYDAGVVYTRSVRQADGSLNVEYLDATGKKIDVFGSGRGSGEGKPKTEEEKQKEALAKKVAKREALEAAQKQSAMQQEQQAEQQVRAGVPGVTSTDWALSGMSGMNERPMTFPVTPQSSVIGNILAPYNKPRNFETGGLLTPPGY